jgi:hypothetical protein
VAVGNQDGCGVPVPGAVLLGRLKRKGQQRGFLGENDRGCPFLTGLGRAPALRCELARKSKTLAHRSKFTSAAPLTSDSPDSLFALLSGNPPQR